VSSPADPALAARYIELLKGCLSRQLFIDEEPHDVDLDAAGVNQLLPSLRANRWRLVSIGGDPDRRLVGHDWPPFAETMIGNRRLDNLIECVTDVLSRDVPGDLIETGVWRGGSTILMRGLLAAWAEVGRRVWVADSFQGVPPPNAEHYPADREVRLDGIPVLEVSMQEVRENFARYGLLDDQVVFLPGWFKDTLASAPIDALSVMRLDGDLYESTMDALVALYPKLSVGGYVIVDDYGGIEACRQAVTDYRRGEGITDPVQTVDWTGVYWRRSA
jgi:O-methyltransferase